MNLLKTMTIKEYKESLKKKSRKERKNKYNNIKTEYQGRFYDSKEEAKYARYLDIMKLAVQSKFHVVFWLPQVPFLFKSGIRMIVDFVVFYRDKYELVDVKGGKATRTKVYRLKKKLLKDEYGLDLREVG